MPTWEEAQRYLRERFKLLHDEPTWVGLVWRFPDDPDLHKQRIEPIQALGRPCLVIISDSTLEAVISTRDALAHNMTLAIGALALKDGCYVMRHVIPLDDLTWPVLDRTLEMIAHEAARLKTHRLSALSDFVLPLGLTAHWDD